MDQTDDILRKMKKNLEDKALKRANGNALYAGSTGCCIINRGGGSIRVGGVTKAECRDEAHSYPGSAFEFRVGDDC